MASFTDIIPKFNPYIQQLPVDAMVKVGMEKQKRYDEGLQKIQTQIEQVAGLDIAKDPHKKYLQSKLNELGNNLRSVAAGDFSNFQLVNSVSGMTKQIVKDPTIQNAVYSTQLLRKEQQRMEEAIKSGKSSIENEEWFKYQAASWLNDGDLNTTFSGRYREYRNVDAKLRDVASKIKDRKNSTDIPFQRDAAGNVLYFKTDDKGRTTVSTDPKAGGQTRIDDAMLTVKTEGLTSQKLLDNFYTALDENDKEQLRISSWYHYRGTTKESLKADATKTINTQKNMLAEQVANWAVQLKTNDKLSPEQRNLIEAAIKDGNNMLQNGAFEKKLAESLVKIDDIQNLDEYKYKTYTQKFLTDLSENLANDSRIEEIKTNPYAQMDMQKKQLQFQVERARVQDAQFDKRYALDVRRLQLEEETAREKKAEKDKLQPIIVPGGLSTGVKVPTIVDVANKIDETEALINTLSAKNKNIMFPELSDNIMVTDPVTGRKISQRQLAINQRVNDYIANPSIAKTSAEVSFLENMRKLQNQLARQNNLYISTSNIGKPFEEQITNLIKGIGGVVDRNGKELVSAKDLVEVTSKYYSSLNFKSLVPSAYGVTSGNLQSAQGISGKAGISSKFIENLPQSQRALGRIFLKEANGETLTDAEKVIVNRGKDLYKNFKSDAESIVSSRQKAQSDFLAKNMPEVQSVYGTLNLKDDVTKAGIEYVVGNATETYNRMGALDVEKKSMFDPAIINTWRAEYGDDKLTYVAEKRYDGSGVLNVYSPKNEKQSIPMTPAELQKYFRKVAQTSIMTDIKHAIQSSPARTTNSMGVQNPATAYLSGNDLPGLSSTPFAGRVRIDVLGDADNDGSENDRFDVLMYVNDGKLWRNPIVINNQLGKGYVNAAGAEEILNGIGTVTVKDVLNQK